MTHGIDPILFATPGPAQDLVDERGLRFEAAPDARFHPSMRRMSVLRSLVRREDAELVHAWDWWQCLEAYYGAAPAVRRANDRNRHDDGSDTNTAEVNSCNVRNAGGSGQSKRARLSSCSTSGAARGHRCELARSGKCARVSRTTRAGTGRYCDCDGLEAFATLEGGRVLAEPCRR